jgi:hypothetical protein
LKISNADSLHIFIPREIDSRKKFLKIFSCEWPPPIV